MKAIILFLLLQGCTTFKQPTGIRVGISQNILQRKDHWKRVYPKLYNWTLRKCGLSYREAQDLENKYLKKGFDGHPGGLKKPGKGYCVYTFQY